MKEIGSLSCIFSHRLSYSNKTDFKSKLYTKNLAKLTPPGRPLRTDVIKSGLNGLTEMVPLDGV